MKFYEYTYTVKEVDLINSNVLVEYKSIDENFVSFTLNLPGHLKNEDDTFMNIEDLIKLYAPHSQWEAQEYIKSQYDIIINKTDTVIK